MSQIPPNATEPLGILILKSRGVFTEAYWYWIGVGAIIGYIFLFNFLYTLALKYLDRMYPTCVQISVFIIEDKVSNDWTTLLQHLGSLRQYNPERPWLRKLRTELDRSLSYHQQEGALLVGHQALRFTFVFLICCILTII